MRSLDHWGTLDPRRFFWIEGIKGPRKMQWSHFSSRHLVFCSSTSSLGTSSPASLVSLRRWWMRANASFPQKAIPPNKWRLGCKVVVQYISRVLLVAHLVPCHMPLSWQPFYVSKHQLLLWRTSTTFEGQVDTLMRQSFASLHARKRWSFEIATGRAPLEAQVGNPYKNRAVFPDVSRSYHIWLFWCFWCYFEKWKYNIPSSIV